jgi:hypothetical protein
MKFINLDEREKRIRSWGKLEVFTQFIKNTSPEASSIGSRKIIICKIRIS